MTDTFCQVFCEGNFDFGDRGDYERDPLQRIGAEIFNFLYDRKDT